MKVPFFFNGNQLGDRECCAIPRIGETIAWLGSPNENVFLVEDVSWNETPRGMEPHVHLIVNTKYDPK